LDIHFTVGTSCERVAPLAEKNAALIWFRIEASGGLENTVINFHVPYNVGEILQ
jgi:hypothetical protein